MTIPCAQAASKRRRSSADSGERPPAKAGRVDEKELKCYGRGCKDERTGRGKLLPVHKFSTKMQNVKKQKDRKCKDCERLPRITGNKRQRH